MNPIRWLLIEIRDIFKFFIDDFKTDLKTIAMITRKMKNKEPIINEKVKEDLKEYANTFRPSEFLKEYWMGILFFILCIVVGWFLASQYYQGRCNQFIQDTLYAARLSGKFDYSLLNLTKLY